MTCILHVALRALPTTLLHSTKCKTLNPKRRKLHLDLALSLIPNQSYARMHQLCVGYAYVYSYYAYLGIFIHECQDVHIGTGNSHPDMDEHRLLHDCFMLDMNIWKKPNFRYDYMHIWVLSRFISRIFDISGQHWLAPWFQSFSFKLFLFQKSQIWFHTGIYIQNPKPGFESRY